jgi:hypothetical protein
MRKNPERRAAPRVFSIQLKSIRYDFVYHSYSLILKAATLNSRSMESGARIKMEDRKGRVSYVIGPDGSPLTLADLPPPGTRRWVIRRKAEVVAAVRGGLLSLDDACKRYTLTVEEFLAWQRAIERFGMPGLRATRVQQYRN